MNDTIEIELPKDSLIRSLVEGGQPDIIGDDSEIKQVQHTLTDEEYQTMLQQFTEHMRNQAEYNKPEHKLKRRLEEFREQRKPVMYRGLKKGFLESKTVQSSPLSHQSPSQNDS